MRRKMREGTRMSKEADFVIYAKSAYTEDSMQLVFGWGSVYSVNGVPYVDTQDDLIDEYELEKAVYDFMLAPKHDEMHERIVPDSKIIESVVITDSKLRAMFPDGPYPTGNRGWWLGIRIFDKEVYAKHKSGEYTGFSITGTAIRKEV